MMGFVPLPTYWIRHNIYIHSKNNREEKVVLFAILLFLSAIKSLPSVGSRHGLMQSCLLPYSIAGTSICEP